MFKKHAKSPYWQTEVLTEGLDFEVSSYFVFPVSWSFGIYRALHMLMQIIEVFHQALCSSITLCKNKPMECQVIQPEFSKNHK